MGALRNYTQGDVIARYKNRDGHNVLHPMAGTPFGCQREIRGPMDRWATRRTVTYATLPTCAAQMKPLGLSIDWSREFCDLRPGILRPANKRCVVDFLAEGLVYRKNAIVNLGGTNRSDIWTVLANEQVEAGARLRVPAPLG